MFTGIVEEVGSVEQMNRRGGDATVRIHAVDVLAGINLGDSLAVNGVCLTVTESGPNWFTVDLSSETLRRTNLGALRTRDPVNLERSLTMAGRIGGHFVQGHVDTVGEVIKVVPEGRGKLVRIRAPLDVMRYVVPKGYIAVDGMSLTVVEPDSNSFSVAFIPHTLSHTVAQYYRIGTPVNLEVDVLGKYVERILSGRPAKVEEITSELLQANGFLS